MRRKHEVIHGHCISCWDDGPRVADRYTVVFLDDVYRDQDGRERVPYLAMSDNPFHPQGVCQHGDMALYSVAYIGLRGVFKKRIPFNTLPEACQRAVLQEWGTS